MLFRSAAIGKKADWLTQNHDLSNALGYNSPLHRLYREKGKILMIGVGLRAATMIHLAESLSGLAYTKLNYSENWSNATAAVAPDGTTVYAEQSEFPGCSAFFPKIEGLLCLNGINSYGKIGNADSQLIASAPMVDETVKLLKIKPEFFLCDNLGCPCCPRKKEIMRQ